MEILVWTKLRCIISGGTELRGESFRWGEGTAISFIRAERIMKLSEQEVSPILQKKICTKTSWIKETLSFNSAMIIISFLSPHSLLRSLNNCSLECGYTETTLALWSAGACGHTFWLYLFLWEILRSVNLALAVPWCAAITLCEAPCNYKPHHIFIGGPTCVFW